MPKTKKTETAPVSAEATAPATPAPKAAKPKASTAAAMHKRATKKNATTLSEKIPVVPAAQETVQVTAVREPETPNAMVAAPKRSITREDIALRAYSYWVARGYQGGSPEEDWLTAERELLGE